MSLSRRWWVAAVVVVLAAAGPAAWAHQGGGDPDTYRWVEPPPGVDSAAPGGRSVRLDRSASLGPWAVWTEDLQAVVTVPDGARIGGERWTVLDIELTPVGPSVLPDLPDGLVVDGNAYRATATDPAGAHLDDLIEVRLVLPHEASQLWTVAADRLEPTAFRPSSAGGYAALVPSGAVVVAGTTHGAGAAGRAWAVPVVAGSLVLLGFLVVAARGVERRRASSEA